MTIWKAIADFPGYRVSDDGRVASCWKQIGPGEWEDSGEIQRVLSVDISHNGYPYVVLRRDGQPVRLGLHRVVAAAFVGEIGDNMDVHFRNGDTADARSQNLEILTRQQNLRRITKRAKPLSREEVLRIRHLRREGASLAELAEEYGVTLTCISNISRGKTYADIGGPIIAGSHQWRRANKLNNPEKIPNSGDTSALISK